MIDLQAQFSTHNFHPRGVIHIGANDGSELATYRAMGMKTIFFIETNPAVYARLQKKMEGEAGVLTACLPARSLDDLMDERGLNPADFDLINMDIQGAELLAVQGAPRTLAHIYAINSEVNFQELFQGCALIPELELFLHERGFHRAALVTPHYPSPADALYLKRPAVAISTLGSNGRLANQLFQYAFLRIYGEMHGAIVQTSHWTGQSLFGVHDPTPQTIFPQFQQLHPDSDPWLLDESRPPLLNHDFKGFFQFHSREYLPHRDTFRRVLTPLPLLQEYFDDALERARSRWRTIVGIHVRRGDYGHGPFFVTPCAWFTSWLRQIWHSLDAPVLFLASDDTEAVRAQFADFPTVTAKDLGLKIAGMEEYQDFYLLTQCDVLAISNSSYSFLAAMLNRRAGLFVRADPETKGMIPFDPWNAPVIFREEIAPELHREFMNSDLGALRNGASDSGEELEAIPIHFFTIVLNGEPFIRHHLEQFLKLPFRWQWHIIEGVAELKHDTAWSLPNGGRISDELHDNGLSNDGTTSYLDQIAREHPGRIAVHRKPGGQFWDGKREMVNAPLAAISEECLLWQVDADELWRADNITAMRSLFAAYPGKTAAYFHCDYFVGPRKYVSSLNTWATYPGDWLRVWRFTPGMSWSAHEPPLISDRQGRNPALIAPFSRDETLSQGITFQHFAYATESQVRFKEIYYGYRDAVSHWRVLQRSHGPVNPGEFLPWAKNDATVDDWPAGKGELLMESLPARGATPKSYSSMSVDGETQFEAELRRIFRGSRPISIIETGTYLGQGTSSIIWRALHDFRIDADFTTMEVNPRHHQLALAHFNSQGMKIRAELGISVPRDLLPNRAEIADRFIANREYDGIYYDHDESVRADLYYSETNFNVADDLLFTAMQRCGFKPEFVLLDSAGHMGFIEFQYLMSLIQGDFILMLDDIHHCKHFKTLQVIKKDPRFEIIVESREKFGFCIARYTHVRSLLLIQTGNLGDNVLASAMLPHLQKTYPDATITMVCQEQLTELYTAAPTVQRVIGFNKERAYGDESYREHILREIRDVKAELCLNTLHSRTPLSDLLALEGGAKISIAQAGDLLHISSAEHARNSGYYHCLLPNSAAVTCELGWHKEFLAGIGIDCGELELPFWASPEDVENVHRLFRESALVPEKTIAFFAGAQDGINRYDGYGASLSKICREQGLSVIALGTKEEYAVNQTALEAMGVRTLNLCGATTLRQSGMVISSCRLAVGGDTGLAQIACAVGTSNVILLGGPRWGRYLPHSPLTSVVSLPLECYGCNGNCRYQRAHCIAGIAPETITRAIRETLAAPSRVPRLFAQSSNDWQPGGNEPQWVPAESILGGSDVTVRACSIIHV